MSYSPLISVIINNYNYDRYLAEAIESVLKQTYEKYELIIVDDGSEDGSRSIIDSYYNNYKDVILPIFKKNGGQASAFNAGFAASKGEVICFLDSDDYWFPIKLERIIPCHADYGIVQHNLLINGERKYMNLNNKANWQILMKEYGYVSGLIPTSGISFSRNVLDKVFPLPDDRIRLGADAFVRWNSMYFSPIYSLDESLGYYRVHGGNIFYEKLSKEGIDEIVSHIKSLLNEKLISQGYPRIPFDEHDSLDILFNNLAIKRCESYLLYGTGSLSEKLTDSVLNKGGSILFYSDSNEMKWGNTFLGKMIIPPQKIMDYRSQFDRIVIASSYFAEILAYLEKIGFDRNKDIVFSDIL